MPLRDGTGPLGQGPLTGRGLGPCSGDPVPFIPGRGLGLGRGRGLGRGFGRGLGFGAGWGARFAGYGAVAPEAVDEKSLLQERLNVLESALAAVRRRLGDLEQGGE